MVTSFHFFSTALDVFCHLGSGLNPQALFHPETGGSEQVYSFCDQMIILCSKYQVQLDCQTCCMWNISVQGHTLAIKAQQEPVCQISKQAQRTFRPHQNPVWPAFPHAPSSKIEPKVLDSTALPTVTAALLWLLCIFILGHSLMACYDISLCCSWLHYLLQYYSPPHTHTKK